jgi:hypothetical protein
MKPRSRKSCASCRSGAGILAGAAVALLVIGYLAIYLLAFLPRGAVG